MDYNDFIAKKQAQRQTEKTVKKESTGMSLDGFKVLRARDWKPIIYKLNGSTVQVGIAFDFKNNGKQVQTLGKNAITFSKKELQALIAELG